MHPVKKYFLLWSVVGALSLVGCGKENAKNLRQETSEVENTQISETDLAESMQEKEERIAEDRIWFSLLDGTTLQIDKDRVHDSYYGVTRLDNRWELDEINIILNSVRGKWKVGEYVGFVAPTIYFPDLWDHNNLNEDERKRLYELYREKTENAASNTPDVRLYIKERYDKKAVEENYIYSQAAAGAVCASPVSIILSLDRTDENYPAFADATAITADFTAEYPVMYIKFFLTAGEDAYQPATLVMTSDDRFYILTDGAFYTLVRNEA